MTTSTTSRNCATWPTTWAHLFEPHNAHVVPIFRIWTYFLLSISGGLANLPAVFARSSYAGLIAAMLALAWVVTRETRQPAAGLLAMAILGLSTVTHPAVTWFSASQALWAATAILVSIALAQAWAAKGGAPRLAALGGAILLAPAVWSGGVLAGPAAIAYLFCKKESRAWRASSSSWWYHALLGLLRPGSLPGTDPWQPNALGKALRRVAAAFTDSAAHGSGSHRSMRMWKLWSRCHHHATPGRCTSDRARRVLRLVAARGWIVEFA